MSKLAKFAKSLKRLLDPGVWPAMLVALVVFAVAFVLPEITSRGRAVDPTWFRLVWVFVAMALAGVVGLLMHAVILAARASEAERAKDWLPRGTAVAVALAGLVPIVLNIVRGVYQGPPWQALEQTMPSLLLTGSAAVVTYVLVHVGSQVMRFQDGLTTMEAQLRESAQLLNQLLPEAKGLIAQQTENADKIKKTASESADTLSVLLGRARAVQEAVAGLLSDQQSAAAAMKQATSIMEAKTRDVSEATAVLMRILGEQAEERYGKAGAAGPPRDALLGPLGANATAWLDLIENPDTQDAKGTLAMLGRSYFWENTFDIRNRHLVTNAKNYTTFLYRAVLRLAQDLPAKGQVLHYCTVTTFDPYDALNCPHPPTTFSRSVKDVIFCHEEGFLSEYFSTFIRELCSQFAASVRHQRFILCLKDDEVLEKHPRLQTWKLPPHVVFELASSDRVFDVPVNFDALPRWNQPTMQQLVLARTSPANRPVILDTQYCPSYMNWLKEQHERGELAAFRPIFSESVQTASLVPSQTTDAALAVLKDRVDKGLEGLECALLGKLPTEWGRLLAIWKAVESYDIGGQDAFIHILSVAQHIKSDLTSRHDEFERLVTTMQQARTAHRFKRYLSGLGRDDLPNLLGYFAQEFHTLGAASAHCVPLDSALAGTWMGKKFRRIPPEFALFGYGPMDAKPAEVEWFLALSSKMTFPWLTSEIRFVLPGAPASEERLAEPVESGRDPELADYKELFFILAAASETYGAVPQAAAGLRASP